ncbi:hypothetical protein ZWY2020_019752 [Hordeum vulgare]|nr:hypothetical protein ZWY2020_019752 [Hordeum vulgare]
MRMGIFLCRALTSNPKSPNRGKKIPFSAGGGDAGGSSSSSVKAKKAPLSRIPSPSYVTHSSRREISHHATNGGGRTPPPAASMADRGCVRPVAAVARSSRPSTNCWVVHWLEHSLEADNVDWVVFLDGDQIVRGPIIPWELGVEKGKPIAAYYVYGFSQQFRVDDPSVHFST